MIKEAKEPLSHVEMIWIYVRSIPVFFQSSSQFYIDIWEHSFACRSHVLHWLVGSASDTGESYMSA